MTNLHVTSHDSVGQKRDKKGEKVRKHHVTGFLLLEERKLLLWIYNKIRSNNNIISERFPL